MISVVLLGGGNVAHHLAEAFLASKDVTLKNNQSSLRADVIEVDIKKKDIKIFMHEENKKVNIKSLN